MKTQAFGCIKYSQIYSRNAHEFSSSFFPVLSPLRQIFGKATGKGARRRGPEYPIGSAPQCVMAFGVLCPAGVLVRGLCPLALLTLLQGSHLQNLGGLSIPPAAQLELNGGLDGGGSDRVATWARAQERGWVLTLELKGHQLAALRSYKNGKSRFFMM